MDLVEKTLANILDRTTQKMTILKAKIHIYHENFSEALVILSKFLEQNPKNYEVHIIKGTLCFQTE
jgi:Flp pilus assembly protein TadD